MCQMRKTPGGGGPGRRENLRVKKRLSRVQKKTHRLKKGGGGLRCRMGIVHWLAKAGGF